MTAGYPTTPLADTLGLKPGMRVFIADMPDDVRSNAALHTLGLELLAAPSAGIDAAHIFVTAREDLVRDIGALRQLITPGGFIWVSWPHQDASCDVDEAVVREVAQPVGLADVKACALDDHWAGMKLMVRQEPR